MWPHQATPRGRLKDRRTLNFSDRVRDFQPPVQAFLFPGAGPVDQAYKTPFLDVRGLTFHNVFLSIYNFRIDPIETQVELVVELLESFGSSGSSAARTIVFTGVQIKGAGGVGAAFPVIPLLQNESQALEFAGAVLMRADRPSRLEFDVRGMLAAGYSIEQRA